MLPGFAYVRAASVAEAVKHAAAGAAVHAGGTDLLGCLHDGVYGADKLVSLSRIEGLKGIRESSDGGLELGALATLAEVAAHPLVIERYAVLARAASEVASPQLRNQGTLGGNLCQKPRCWYYRGAFPCIRKGGEVCYAVSGQSQHHAVFGGDSCFIVHPSDTAPALAALGATVRLAGPDGTRVVPVEKFFVLPEQDATKETVLEPGEIVTRVHVPRPARGLVSSYRKVRARRVWDFALAGVALALELRGERVRRARVILSGAAPVPWRSLATEAVLEGSMLDARTINRAAEAVVEGAEPLEHNGYKLELFRGLLVDELHKLLP